MTMPIQIGLMLQCCLLGSFWKSGSAASRSQNQWVCDWCVYSHSVAHTSFVRKLVNCLSFIWVPRLLNWYWSTEQKWVGVRKSHSTCLPVEFSEQLFFFFFFKHFTAFPDFCCLCEICLEHCWLFCICWHQIRSKHIFTKLQNFKYIFFVLFPN